MFWFSPHSEPFTSYWFPTFVGMTLLTTVYPAEKFRNRQNTLSD